MFPNLKVHFMKISYSPCRDNFKTNLPVILHHVIQYHIALVGATSKRVLQSCLNYVRTPPVTPHLFNAFTKKPPLHEGRWGSVLFGLGVSYDRGAGRGGNGLALAEHPAVGANA